ncbi:HEPN domain protein [Methanobrevibacter cuticularis]|uniref:HEPN domain protein n=1 Tax=Methanobrevibacter cuticularis TaxID=47311 RepID=A0A166E8A3_9EURY|nr:HEPN domain-containing protein [Methanobrevibacter cuticularis]KZX16383.1 HEPN domain protein [Methanobrevibacter cuticularis]
MSDIDYAFKRALELLEVSELLYNNKHYADSINRSYYSVFYATKALLIKKEIDAKKHSGLIHQFGLAYIINDNFNKNTGKILSRLEEDRIHADYDMSIPITKEKAEEYLYNAKIFIKECKKFL